MSGTVAAHIAHLKRSRDLVTTYEQRRAGFVGLALERTNRASHFVVEARALKAAAGKARQPSELLTFAHISAGLLTAAGVSDKAKNHLTEEDKEQAVRNLVKKYLEPAGEKFVEELVYRFLLTRGDALGGSMRNVGGELARRKLVGAIVAALNLGGITFRWAGKGVKVWNSQTDSGGLVAEQARGLAWAVGRKPRTLLYNLKVPLVGNNVDLCLLNVSADSLTRNHLKEADSYIALGELKGGIDPAGADEHWKTAGKAFERIRDSFRASAPNPRLFFVGAAIEQRMADEIWSDLKNGRLSNAANLNDDDQLHSMCSWIVRL